MRDFSNFPSHSKQPYLCSLNLEHVKGKETREPQNHLGFWNTHHGKSQALHPNIPFQLHELFPFPSSGSATPARSHIPSCTRRTQYHNLRTMYGFGALRTTPEKPRRMQLVFSLWKRTVPIAAIASISAYPYIPFVSFLLTLVLTPFPESYH